MLNWKGIEMKMIQKLFIKIGRSDGQDYKLFGFKWDLGPMETVQKTKSKMTSKLSTQKPT